MNKKKYLLALALLLAVMVLAACGGAGGGTGDSGEAPAAPAADATVTTEAQGTGGDTAGTGGDTVSEGASTGSDASGAGDTSGGNAAGEAGSATDVGSGSDGAQGSGGSDEAGGTTSPESDTGQPVQGDDTGNAASGTGDTGTGAAGAYTAVSDAECTEIQNQLTQALGVDVSRTTGAAAFEDLSGGTGESCQLTATGTGVQFPSMVDAAQRISQALTTGGWTADPQYAADSPTGTIGGLRRDNQLAAYNVEWTPGPAASCPADQPIAVCFEALAPDQVIYNITVDLAQQ